ncbi:MAG: DUF3990 domain-containing protein, partial [Prevotellaceae bacterium]|nr:DUF3990 domain-containing protein [Prevotellaceae bacterium]
MKLYHGTNVWFDKVDLSKCTHYPDSGRGFFLTSDLNTAIEIVKCRWKNTNESLIVFEYEVDLDHFSKENPQLKIMQYSGINEEWIHFAMFNR